MISYITIGSNDLAASAVFFDSLFGAVDGTRAYSLDKMIGYSFGPENPMIIVTCPFDGEAATHGNGTMIALAAKDRAHVDAVHALALQIGATDEGTPGRRGKNFYGGYFRDLDGNKFNICLTS
ncbi:VOC family protein [uncultured Litoreibacter sp.]|uniref:VOC family protein n=1 Tax=uncultured Litoreibacter sp. TaxID=1392394 RepID=UPI002607EBD6|nr:VOC family protein [uncultured Litoreibacter sp.]